MLKKKILANFQRIIELFTQKIVTKLSKIWILDPGSEIRDPEKTYSGSRIQGSKRHRIPDPDPQHCSPSYDLAPASYPLHFSRQRDVSLSQSSFVSTVELSEGRRWEGVGRSKSYEDEEANSL